MKGPHSYASFHRKLHEWYALHGRHSLPWRNTQDPYEIYISEVMLQQTQVKTVLERFYFPFLAKFPTLQSLADAPHAEVLKRWEGLGYYNRAANLHEAAKQAAPALPDTVEALQALPGIGKNTAHAVAAFGFHIPVPVMEANVKRVLCRIFALRTPKPEELWEKAFQLLDEDQPYDYNQAMMDIGSMVCTKRAPKCLTCPANEICSGKIAPEAYPEKLQKKAVPVREAINIVWQDNRGYYYMKPREGAFLRGLYGFPEYPVDAEVLEMQGRKFSLREAVPLGTARQTYSHFHQVASVYRIMLNEAGEGEGWYFPDSIKNLALSGIDHKILVLAV